MKNAIYLSIFLLVFFACNNSKKPDGILDRNTYKNILKEVIMVDIIRNHHKIKDSLHFNPLQLVYQKYQVDSLIMKKNADYYAKHPETLKEIYKEIKDTYQFKLDSVEKNDSIRRKRNKTKPQKKFDSITIPTNILGKSQI